MIPKKIHYCWLSGDKLPDFLQNCIKTWHDIMPEYDFILWDKERFDISSVPYVNDAYKAARKINHWGPAADYIRLYALYTEGGIYLDTDIIVRKSFDDLLQYDFFTSHEWWEPSIKSNNTLSLINSDGTLKENILRRMYGVGIQAAVLGSVQGHPFLKDLLDWYNTADFSFINPKDGVHIIAPDIYAFIARKYGYKYLNIFQELDANMVVFPSCFFPNSIGEAVKESYAIHFIESSFRYKKGVAKLRQTLARNDSLRRILKMTPYFNKILEEIDKTIARKTLTT
jgi:hypothetical protein